MSLAKTVKIKFKGKEYFIDSKKTLFVLSKLENKPIKCKNEKELKNILKGYKLYDEIFLDRINGFECN